MKSFRVVLVVACLVVSCGEDRPLTLLTRELNTAGTIHTLSYQHGVLSKIMFETFYGSGTRDTLSADTILRRDIDSVQYGADTHTILLLRRSQDDTTQYSNFRKYYFNSDNLLTKITRFGSGREYMTDSLAYDYTMQIAHYFDLINKHEFELVYDSRMNIESETEKRMGDGHVFHTNYYYYDAAQNPFLVNLDDELFACFHYRNAGLFWNNATRPLFSSRNNVQSFKEEVGKDERNGLFEYQYRHGIPATQFGNNGVIYYRYTTVNP